MYKGRLDKWDDARGYGFIKTAELAKAIFIHITVLKHMSRKPRPGDVIHFELEQNNGKLRATQARIEGVESISKPRIARGYKSHFNFKLSYVVVLIVIFTIGSKFPNFIPNSFSEFTALVISEFNIPAQADQVHNINCDGRQYCSQMTSRAEAEYFNAHCPNTKMDGDNDGYPCENDSRF